MQISLRFGLILKASKPIVPQPDPISIKFPNSGNSKSASTWTLISLLVIKLGLSVNVS